MAGAGAVVVTAVDGVGVDGGIDAGTPDDAGEVEVDEAGAGVPVDDPLAAVCGSGAVVDDVSEAVEWGWRAGAGPPPLRAATVPLTPAMTAADGGDSDSCDDEPALHGPHATPFPSTDAQRRGNRRRVYRRWRASDTRVLGGSVVGVSSSVH
jgi:hypothetical protein